MLSAYGGRGIPSSNASVMDLGDGCGHMDTHCTLRTWDFYGSIAACDQVPDSEFFRQINRVSLSANGAQMRALCVFKTLCPLLSSSFLIKPTSVIE